MSFTDILIRSTSYLAPSTGAANQVMATPAIASDAEKKIKTITKKLRQITELKERLARGDQLEQTQVSLFLGKGWTDYGTGETIMIKLIWYDVFVDSEDLQWGSINKRVRAIKNLKKLYVKLFRYSCARKFMK